ncbi:MAG: hypothetical protein E7642_03405 [Ruminococcaceae bacterium]|nr:hypothetical protein [Oscillospiraceae bacterium]
MKAQTRLDLPIFNAENVSKVDCGENTQMTCIEGTTADAYNEYCDAISNAGFEKISSRKETENLFTTFVCDKDYVYVYYTAYNSEIRVIAGPIESLLDEDCRTEISDGAEAYLASIPQPSDGNGYIIRIPDGRFLISDAGYRDGDRVYKALRELEEGKIVIAAWFISHPHGDHYPAFIDFIRDHYNDESVVIERVIFNYAYHELYNIKGTAGVEMNGREVIALYESLKQYAPELPVLRAHTGQVMDLGSATVEILYTVEDLLPRKIFNINNTSLVVRVNTCGHKIMLLADTCYDSAPIMIKTWGDYLSSDIMQVAHHGIWPSIKELYDSVRGEVAIYPAAKRNLCHYIRDTRWAASTEAILKYAKDIYIACDSMIKIDLPYSIQNNKEQVLSEL